MRYQRTIRHILAGTLICLALVGLSATYWALAGQDSLLLREDNPRIIEAQRDVRRGGIFDKAGRPLAQTVQGDAGLERRYPQASAYSIVGYYSLRYGVGGAESAYEALLSGARPIESIADYFKRKILNRPQIGADIMLTLDVALQESFVSALADAAGTAIVLDARNGAVLALVSQPSFNPNTLDADWSRLVEAEGKPFFNRALQGNYQIGANIYLIWLAQALESGFDLSWRFTDAADPVDLGDGMTAACLVNQAEAELTLGESLAFGCPAAFASYRQTESALAYDDLLSPYAFHDPLTLAGFPQREAIDLATDDDSLSPADLELRNALGQGNLTTTPLHLATIIAAIANDGLAAEPALLSGLRQPASDPRRPRSQASASRRMMRAETAQGLQLVLRDAWSELWAPPIDSPLIGAYIARSYSGDETQLWLNGYVKTDDDDALAFVVLLEDTDDISQILSIGRELIDIFAGGQ